MRRVGPCSARLILRKLFDVAKHIIVMEFDEAPSPVDPEVRAYVYSLVSAVSKFPP